jgi:hypothetical protein
MSNVDFTRPEYDAVKNQWQMVRDCVSGSMEIKRRGEKYLPKPVTPGGQTEIDARYQSYLERATFYEVTANTQSALIGQVFEKPPTVELPAAWEYLIDDFDGAGLTFTQHSKMVTADVLAMGRGGMLVDMVPRADGETPTQEDVQNNRVRPNVVFYTAESIINWETKVIDGQSKLAMVVLREYYNKKNAADIFQFDVELRHRVLRLDEDDNLIIEIYEDKDSSPSVTYEPTDATGGRWKEIPFVFIGSENNDERIDKPPLHALSDLNIAHYRNSADYEQSVFLVGQPTPVVTGLTQSWIEKNPGPYTLGSAVAWTLPTGANAELLEASPNTMAFEAMKHKEDQMKAIGAKLIDANAVQRTATEAKIEASNEASLLVTIVQNVSDAYTKAIGYMFQFLNQGGEQEVEIELNTEFTLLSYTPQELLNIMAIWQGGGLAYDEVRNVLKHNGLAEPDNDDAARSEFDQSIDIGNPPTE